MRIMLLGNTGQLGWELQRTLAPLGELFPYDYPQMDITNPSLLRKTINEIRPNLIVNATAYTAVDKAEEESELCMMVNAEAPKIIAEEANNVHAALIHYSTDYVFDGEKNVLYTEEDIPNPLNTYGKSKLQGEKAIQQLEGAYLILRTSWVYSLRRNSFVKKVLEWSRKQSTLRLVTDQIGNPTWSRMLAEITSLTLASAPKDIFNWMNEYCGIYHLAGEGYASRFECAKAILEFDPNKDEQMCKEIQPALTVEFPTQAIRPLYSALNCERFFETFQFRLPGWKESLKMALDSI